MKLSISALSLLILCGCIPESAYWAEGCGKWGYVQSFDAQGKAVYECAKWVKEPSCTQVCKATYYWVCGIDDVCIKSPTPTPDENNCFTREYREEGAVERVCGSYSVKPNMRCDCIPTENTIAPSAHGL